MMDALSWAGTPTGASFFASLISGLSVYYYGHHREAGPLWGLVSQVPWWIVTIGSGLWGLALANTMFTALHVRNLLVMRRLKRTHPFVSTS